MSIQGFNCPVCKRQVPTDHYATADCGLHIPADYAMAILHDQDERYITDEVTVTAGLGCPRSRAIEQDSPVFINPLDYNALLIGRAWDKLMEKHAPEGMAKIELEGTIEGVHIFGEIDRVVEQGDKFLIVDHKHGNNWAQKYAVKEGVRYEYRIQVSIYSELYFQQFGRRPTHGLVFNHYSGAAGGATDITKFLLPFIFEFLPLAECLAHKPYGGQYTVLELYKQAEGYYAAKKAKVGDPFALPLAGDSGMAFGSKSFCDYCSVRTECFTAAKGAAF